MSAIDRDFALAMEDQIELERRLATGLLRQLHSDGYITEEELHRLTGPERGRLPEGAAP